MALRYMSGQQLATQRSERTEKLAWMERQIAAGELVIRSATVEERERYAIGAVRPAAVPRPPRSARPAVAQV